MSKKKKIIYFHIGYPKTATTFLQKNFFRKHPQINYLSRHYGNKDNNLSKILNYIFDLNDDKFDQNKKNLKKIFNKIKFLQHKINLISEEDVLCHKAIKNNNIYKTLKRINFIFNDKKNEVKYFFFIRKQKDIIISYYRQFYFTYFSKNFPQFNKFINDRNKGKVEDILNSFKYYELYLFLKSITKKKNIKIFLYEDLKNNIHGCLKSLCKYLHIHQKLNKKIAQKKHEKTFDSIKHLNLLEGIKKNFKDYKALIKFFPIKFAKFAKIIFVDIIKIYFIKKKLKNLPNDINYEKKIKFFYLMDNKKLKKIVKTRY